MLVYIKNLRGVPNKMYEGKTNTYLKGQSKDDPIKISSKVENSTGIFRRSRIRKGIKQYQSINPYAKITGNREATEGKKEF